MNAYELADEAKRQSQLIYLVAEEPVAKQLSQMLTNYETMLRQQADQLDKVIPQLVRANGLIENLRIRIAELEKTNQEMMSRPVAIPYAWHCRWFDEDGDESWEQYEKSHPATRHWDVFPDKIIPLYTHPVKPLTEQRIREILKGIDKDQNEDGWWETSIGVKFGKTKLEELIKEITE